MDRNLVLKNAGKACLIVGAVVIGIVGTLHYLPYRGGGASFFLIFPVYNLVCTNSCQTNTGAALFYLPKVENFQAFLNNQGCSLSDADSRDQLSDRGTPSDHVEADTRDVVRKAFGWIVGVMARAFTEGQSDGASWLIYAFKKNVLFEALYYVLYTLLTICVIQLTNSATQDIYRLAKLLLVELTKSDPPQ